MKRTRFGKIQSLGALLALLAGCYNPVFRNAQFKCDKEAPICPDVQYCNLDCNLCLNNGQKECPGATKPDGGTPGDMGDMGGGDPDKPKIPTITLTAADGNSLVQPGPSDVWQVSGKIKVAGVGDNSVTKIEFYKDGALTASASKPSEVIELDFSATPNGTPVQSWAVKVYNQNGGAAESLPVKFVPAACISFNKFNTDPAEPCSPPNTSDGQPVKPNGTGYCEDKGRCTPQTGCYFRGKATKACEGGMSCSDATQRCG